MAQISLGWTNGDKKTALGHTIKVKRQKYRECSLFHHITYDIEKPEKKSEKKFNLVEFLYYGINTETPLTYESKRFEINQIQVYVSEFHPNVPLVLFVDLGDKLKKWYKPRRERFIIYDRSDLSVLEPLNEVLLQENKNNNGKINLLKTSQQKDNISVITTTISSEDKSTSFEKITYVTRIDKPTKSISDVKFSLSLNCLFSNLEENDTTELHHLADNTYDAIILYRSKLNGRIQNNRPLFIQFFNDCAFENFVIKNKTDSNKIELVKDSYVHDDKKLLNHLIILQESLFCIIDLFIERHQDYSKENVKSILGQPKTSIYQPTKISVFSPNLGLSNYTGFQHTIKPDFQELLKKLTIKGKQLSDDSELRNLFFSQLVKKLEEKYGTEGKSVGNLLNSNIIIQLKLFLFNNEISTFRSDEFSLSPLFYEGTRKEIIVYFYNHSGTASTTADKVPLMVRYSGLYYKPRSKSDYFTKWVEVTGIMNDNVSQLKPKLDEVNRELNEVNISNNSGSNYGLDKPEELVSKVDQNFCTRITVKKLSNDHFGRITHTTINSFAVGKVFYNSRQITTIQTETSHNEVTVYYHSTDDTFRSPFIMSLGSHGGEAKHNKWYIRSDLEGRTWTHESDTSKYETAMKLQNELADFRKKFFNPLIIQIDPQSTYQVSLENRTSFSGSSKKVNILVVQEESYKSLVSPFLCFKQDLSQYYKDNIENINTGLNKASGESFPDFAFELIPQIYKIPLKINLGEHNRFYLEHKKANNELLVFFSTADNGSCNFPLMFSYDDKYYRPNSRVEYFSEWLEVSDIRGSINTSTLQVKSELEKVNRILNEVDISNTNGSGYGLKRKVSNGKEEEYICQTIGIKRLKGGCYRKVVHSTTDKRVIGEIYLNGSKLDGLNMPKLQANCNQVDVYYLPSDISFNNPLLINICSSSQTDIRNWYYRNENGTEWLSIDKSQFSTFSTTRAELDKISFKNPPKILIQLEQNSTGYSTNVTKSDSTGYRELPSRISLSMIPSLYTIDIKNHRFYGHGVDGAYEKILQDIEAQNRLSIPPEFTFELEINISENPIKLHDRFGRIFNLSYSNDDYSRKRNPEVYFYNGDVSITDTVPLLLKFKGRYFAPENKETYFEYWKEIGSLSGITYVDKDQHHKIETELKRILKMLNEVDTSKLQSYGIPYFQSSYYKKKDFNTKRIQLTRYKGNGYIMRLHHAVNNNLIEGIAPIPKCRFVDHIGVVPKEINEVAVILKTGYLKEPKLILLNEKTFYGSTTYGYYYLIESQQGRPTEYKFENVKSGLNFVGFLTDRSGMFATISDEDVTLIKDLWANLSKENMKDETGPKSDPDTPFFQQTDDAETEHGECNNPGSSQSTFHDLRQVNRASSGYGRNSNTSQLHSERSTVQLQREVFPPSRSPSLEPHSLPQPPQESTSQDHLPGKPSETSEASLGQSESRSPPETTKPKSSISKSPETPKSPVSHISTSRSEELSLENLSVHRSGPERNQSDGDSEREQDTVPNGAESLDAQVGTGGVSDNQTTQEDLGQKILNFIKENPDVVGGAGGGVATVGGGAYPAYRLIAKCTR